MSMILTGYVLKAAVRDRLVIGMFIVMALAVSLSIFMGSAALNEKDQFAAVFAAGSIRFLNVFGLCLFVVFFIRRSFESRDIEYMLTRPVSRVKFLMSYAAGLSIIALISGLFSGLCLYAMSPHLFSEGLILWTLSMAVENVIMMNAALFFAMILPSAATASFAVLGLYVMGRMSGQILGILDAQKHFMHFQGLEVTMESISFFMPRLDLLAQTSWLIYGAEDGGVSYPFILLLGIGYTGVLLLASIIDLIYRKF